MGISTPPVEARCLGCGYALRGLEGGVCPECGRPFDPADPLTYRLPGAPLFLRRFAGPPPRAHVVLAVGYAAAVLLAQTSPGSLGIPICVGYILVPLLVGNYLLAAIACANPSTPRRPEPQATPRTRWWRWRVLPICTLVILTTFVFNWPLFIRFSISRSAFEAQVQRALAIAATRPARPWPVGQGWRGAYFASQIRVGPLTSGAYRVQFYTGGAPMYGWGFEYRTDAATRGESHRALPPGWFVYVDLK